MTDVLDARSVLSILAKRPQPETTWLRQLKPGCDEPHYAVATFVGMFHRKFPLDYSKQFGQRVPDWIWFEHPQTIIDLSNLAIRENRLLPDSSPEPPNLLIQTREEIKTAIQAVCDRMLAEPAGQPCAEYRHLTWLREDLHILGYNTLLSAMRRRDPFITQEALEAMADEFGF